MTPCSAWRMRAYQSGDDVQLVELFARVFAKPITLEHWRWKLRQQPSPTESIWLGVVDTEGDGGAPHTPHETPIFQYAGIPTPYSLDGKTATNMTLVDIMTAPEARRQGLLTQIGQSVNDHWRRASVPFVIGLPNDQWGSRMAALGCEPLCPLQWLVRPLRPMNVLFRRLHIPAPSFAPVDSIWNGFRNRRVKPDTGVRIRLVQKAGPEFDTVWRLCEDDAAFSVVRDSRWVQWRYLDSPSMDYQVALAERASDPVGYAAYRTVHAGGRRVGFPSIGYGGQLSRANRQLTRISLRAATYVTAGSQTLTRMAQNYGPRHAPVCLPLGVDVRLFNTESPSAQCERPLSAGDIRLLHVASLTPVKDQQTLLRAFAQASDNIPGFHMHIVGDGPLLPSLREQARSLGINRLVTFHGAVDHTRLSSYYRSADLFILSSLYESQSMVTLEAAACGCPVVGTAVGVLPDILPSEQLAPPGDSKALASAIIRSMQNRDEARTSAQEIARHVSNTYSVTAATARWEDLYRQ